MTMHSERYHPGWDFGRGSYTFVIRKSLGIHGRLAARKTGGCIIPLEVERETFPADSDMFDTRAVHSGSIERSRDDFSGESYRVEESRSSRATHATSAVVADIKREFFDTRT